MEKGIQILIQQILFKVDEFIQLGVIGKTSELIGKIIKLRRENNNMTARDIQLMFEETFEVNWFKSLILSMFPKSFQDLAKAKAVLGGGSAISSTFRILIGRRRRDRR